MGLYVHHPTSYEHDTGAHPENARRLRAIEGELERQGWLGLRRVEAPAARREQLLRVHELDYVRAIEGFCVKGGGMIDADTVVSERSWEAALHAAGGAALSVPALLKAQDAFGAANGGSNGNYPNHPKWKFVFINHVTTNPFFVPTQYGASDACSLVNCSYQWAGSAKSDVGGACTAVTDCAAGLDACNMDPGGQCTHACTTQADCDALPGGAICETGGGNCYKLCNTKADCPRDGYDCIGGPNAEGKKWCDVIPPPADAGAD